MAAETGLKTPLYHIHTALGGKMVPFAGYLLPVQYPAGLIKEHMAVRTQCGLFDVSHMGEILLTGPDAVKNLNHLLTNDYTHMDDGQARYSPMCNERGGVVDDLIVYKQEENRYLLVVNAANKDKDYQWIASHLIGDAKAQDLSPQFAQLALQGPAAQEILCRLADHSDLPEKYYTAYFDRKVRNIPCIISRTGYTGEDGFELYLAPEDAPDMWNLLMEAGEDLGLLPCGLGARDTLRLEAAMPLYGHEMDEEISPKEAGLGIFVKMDKEDFIGKEALIQREPLTRRRTGLKATGRGIIREHQDVYFNDRKIGVTTSGTHCPYLGYPAAMALIDIAYREPGTMVEVDVRGRRVAAQVVPLPFYKRSR